MPIDLGPNSLLGGAAPTLKKPPYLITLYDGVSGKALNFKRFISLDKPRLENGVFEVKVIFSDKTEEEIIKTFSDILTETPKELLLEMMFSLQRIYEVRNLVFNAQKSVTAISPGKA